jgi:mono/diheme cytochrome c family protein
LPPAGAPSDGETLFQQRCGICHVFHAAETLGRVGPNLDAVGASAAAVKAQVTNGGGLMPSFGNALNSQQIDAIADFVAKNANPKYGNVAGNPS